MTPPLIPVVIKKHPVAAFFALAFVLNWAGIALNLAGLFPGFGEWPVSYDGEFVALFRGRRTLLNWAPNIAAVIVVMVADGGRAVRRLFQKFFVWRVGLRWWLIVLGGPVLMGAFAVFLHLAFGGEADFSRVRALPGVFAIRFLFSLSLGSIGEEAGWRGLALPGLQKRFSPVTAGCILGFVWAVFHWPTLMIRQVAFGYLPVFCLSVMALSLLLSWIYNATGSLLMAALFHNMVNAVDVTLSYSFAALVPRAELMPVMTLVMISAAVVIAVQTRLALGVGARPRVL